MLSFHPPDPRLAVVSLAILVASCAAPPATKPAKSPIQLSEVALGRLAFVSKDNESGKSVFRVNMVEKEQNEARVLAQSSDILLSPAWSPDGKQVAFIAYEDGTASLFVQTLATGQLRRIVQGENVGTPAWSPDGTKLALSISKNRNPDIHVLTLATGALQRITDAPSIETSPAWSPDGTRIAFTSDRNGKPLIYEVTVNDPTHWTRLVGGVRGAFDPSYSPDGKTLVYTVQRGSDYSIELLDLESKATTRLSAGPRDESASFSPNGQFIVYESERDGVPTLEVRALDGSVRQTLRSKGELRQPTWVTP